METPMQFGKYVGVCIADVPLSYLDEESSKWTPRTFYVRQIEYVVDICYSWAIVHTNTNPQALSHKTPRQLLDHILEFWGK